MAHEIRIDRNKPLEDDPGTGHNRFHPDIEPILEVEAGEEVTLETRDASDGQLALGATVAAIATMDMGKVHPLTGPVYIKGAEPGDILEIDFLEVAAESQAFSAIVPGLGFLRDLFTEPFLVHWDLADGWATSEQIPGVRIPGSPFMGVSAVAPSHAEVAAWSAREQALVDRGGFALPPDPVGAVPVTGSPAEQGLRTLPPRENGGNFDVKQLTKGSTLQLPVSVEGGLFSTGDAHFAQGDGEVCVTGVEMGATVTVRFNVLKGEATRRNLRGPRFRHGNYFAPPEWAVPRRFIAVMGLPIDEDGINEGENLTLACRNAVLHMIDMLGERGFTREQAYVICSVAADLRISNVVDAPNFVVSALLPEQILEG